MRTLSTTLFRSTAIATCAVIVANGCMLDRRPILAPYTLVPEQYCPGDTLTAGYDFLRELSCPSGVDCSPFFPKITLSSTPTAFPNTLFQDYRASLPFSAVGDSVGVHFDIDNDGATILIPTRNADGTAGVSIARENVRDGDKTATKINGTIDTELIHNGMCAGATPVNTPISLPGPPRLSPNMHLVQVCNRNSVPIEVTLSGSPSGVGLTQRLNPGDCIDPSGPGMPTGIDGSRVVEARSLLPDPLTRCSATGPSTPPPALRTLARMGCR